MKTILGKAGRGVVAAGMAAFLAVSPAAAKETGFSLKTDPGRVTLKDVRLTLPGDWGNVSFFGRDRLRYEAWDYFALATDNDYEFLANQLRLGARWVHEIFNVNYTHQYTQLSNLPTATSAGAGAGSLYFSNSRDRNSHRQFIKYLNLEIKQTRKLLKPLIGDQKWLRGVTETFGRFNYSSGNEVKSGDAKIDAVKNMRVGDRLIGGFEWTHYGRSFDGVKVAREDDASHVQFAAFNPTQGGFEERADKSVGDVDIIAVEATFKKGKIVPGMENTFFYYGYDDHRNIAATTARFDNSGRSVAAGTESDIELHTFGAQALGAYKIGPGQADVLAWGAYQTGKWYELDHSAYAYALEGGYQMTDMKWKPWLRAGYDVGSGDDATADGEHGSFNQLMPTARVYSFSLLYNMINTEDAFVSLILKPSPVWTVRTEFHDLSLSEKNDRWYIGSGVMHDNVADDYVARASNGSSDLGQLIDMTVVWNVNPDLTVSAYYGHFIGGDVVKRFFTTNRNNDMFFLECAINF